MIHGQLVTSLFFEKVINVLADFYTIIAPDLRGFSHSSYNQPINSFEDYASDLKLFLDKLKIKRASILAWSAGGPTAMTFALRYQDYVESLVLVASVGPKGLPRRDGKSGKYLKTHEEFKTFKGTKEVISYLDKQYTNGIRFLF